MFQPFQHRVYDVFQALWIYRSVGFWWRKDMASLLLEHLDVKKGSVTIWTIFKIRLCIARCILGVANFSATPAYWNGEKKNILLLRIRGASSIRNDQHLRTTGNLIVSIISWRINQYIKETKMLNSSSWERTLNTDCRNIIAKVHYVEFTCRSGEAKDQ